MFVNLYHSVDLSGLVLWERVPDEDLVPYLVVMGHNLLLTAPQMMVLHSGVVFLPQTRYLVGYLEVINLHRLVVHGLPAEHDLLGGLAVMSHPRVDDDLHVDQVHPDDRAPSSLELDDLLLHLFDFVLADQVFVDVVGLTELPLQPVPLPQGVISVRPPNSCGTKCSAAT